MHIDALTLPVAQTWSAAHKPRHYIKQALYAVMREGRVELVMGPHEYMTGEATMHICYAGHEGLHYDADSSICPDYLAALLRESRAHITTQWHICEFYLRSYARELGLANH
jgi:hypothetical protein